MAGVGRLTIRRARPADAGRLCRVHVASIRGLCAEDYTSAQIAAWSGSNRPDDYRRAIAEGQLVFIALAGSRTAGFARCDGGRVRAVYVHPRFARRGVGARLLAAVERAARGRGVRRLRLSSSLTAVRFYRAMGYAAGRRSFHTLRNGRQMPCVPMTKRLPPFAVAAEAGRLRRLQRGRRHKSP